MVNRILELLTFVKKPEEITSLLPADDDSRVLLNHLLKRRTASDETAAAHLGLAQEAEEFRRVVRRLEYLLINRLAHTGTGNAEQDTQLRYAWKLFVIGSGQVRRKDSVIAEDYLREAYEVAVAKDDFLLAKLCAEYLVYLYSNRRFDLEAFDLFADRSAYYRDLNFLAGRLRACLTQLTNLEARGVSRAEKGALVEAALTEIGSELSSYQEVPMVIGQQLLKLRLAQLRDSPYQLIRLCEEAIRLLDQLGGVSTSDYLLFELQLAIAYLQTGQLRRAVSRQELLQMRLPRDKHNYFKVVEHLLISGLRCGEYQYAADLYWNTEAKLTLPGSDQRTYAGIKIAEVYLNLLRSLERIEIAEGRPTRLKGNLGRMPKSVITQPDTMDTVAFHYLLCRVISLITRRKFGDAADALVQLRRRFRRYVGEKGRLLIDTLHRASLQDFNKVATERMCAPEITLLKASREADTEGTLSSLEQGLEEVIPYEELWQIVSDRLRKRRKKRKSFEL